MRVNPSVLFGVGTRGNPGILASVALATQIVAFAPSAFAQPSEFERGQWLATEALPYRHEIEPAAHARLLVVEQAGVDIRIRLPDGRLSATPAGRVGPELLYVGPDEGGRITLEPLHAATGRGAFRLAWLPLDSPAQTDFGAALGEAAAAFGSGTVEGEAQACAEYASLASAQGVDRQWHDLSLLLFAGCLHESGQQLAPERVDEVADEFSFLGVPAYRAAWLKGEHLHAAFSYAAADEQLRMALQLALRAMDAAPASADAIRLDVAEIQSVLGGNAALLAYIAGGNPAVGDVDELLGFAEATLRDSVANATLSGNAFVLGRAWDYFAALSFVRNDSPRVIDYLLRSKAELEKTGNREWLVPVLGSIGDFHKQSGELRAAQAAYLEALNIVDGDTGDGRFADVYDNAGQLYFELGDYARARSNFEIGIDLSLRTGRETRGYSTSRRLASVHEELGDLNRAAELLEGALAYLVRSDLEAESGNWSPYRIGAQSSLSRIERKRGRLERAYTLSAEAMAHIDSRELNVSTDFRSIHINHANILYELGEREQALALLADSIEQYAGEPMPLVDLYGARMELLQLHGDNDGARAMAAQAFELIESQRAQIDAARLGAYWSGRTNFIYSSHADFLLSRAAAGNSDDLALAFEVSERARAISLRRRRLETLLARNESNSAAREQWIALVEAAENSLGSAASEVDRLNYERRLNEARERYFALHGTPVDAPNPRVRSLDDVRSSLSDDEIFVAFVAAPQRMWRIDVSRSQSRATPLGETAVIESLIDSAEFELSNQGVSSQQATLQLGDVLLAGLDADQLSDKRLLISASSNLSALPIAALRRDGSLLADLAVIVNVPSISGFLDSETSPSRDSQPQRGERLQLAVLADPDFGQPRASTLVPESDSQIMRAWADTLERLPASAEEAASLAEFYSEAERRILLGSDATQRNFFDPGFLDARIIHIATHAYFDESMPDLVGFATAQDGPDDDGFVSLAEISAQIVSADLVVISACSTARGTEIAGEGSMSLARTFLAQGVGAVISTLWPVSDAATARFMSEFYRAINEGGQSYAEALRTAQTALRSSRRFRDPFYWSAYTLTTADARAI